MNYFIHASFAFNYYCIISVTLIKLFSYKHSLVLVSAMASFVTLMTSACFHRPIGHRGRKRRGGPAGDSDQSSEEPDHEKPLERSRRLHQAAAEAA